MCGGFIDVGEPIDKMSFSTTFTLHKYLFDLHAPHRCGHCARILETPAFLQELSSGVYHAGGFMPVAKKVHRGYAMLHPPSPPFVYVIQADRSQHMIWRAPVCYSQDVIKLLCGDQIHQVRGKLFQQALTVAKDAQQKWLSLQPPSRQKANKKLPSPLGFNDLKGKAVGIGELQKWFQDLIDGGELDAGATELFSSLNHSEAWALDSALSEIEKPRCFKSFNEYFESKRAAA